MLLSAINGHDAINELEINWHGLFRELDVTLITVLNEDVDVSNFFCMWV